MNPVFQQIIIDATLKGKKTNKGSSHAPSRYFLAKTFVRFKIVVKREILNTILLCLGIGIAAFGLKSFLLPIGFIDGGITGISLLLTKLTGWPLAILIPLLNVPFILLGYNQIGKTFAIKTTLAVLGLSFCIASINYPVLTNDKLLVAVFGGFFLGAGIGLAIRGCGVLDGTEVMAIYIGKKSTLTIGDVILVLNIIIFSFAAWLLSVETAFYSILTYLAASKTVDFLINGIEEYTGVILPHKNQKRFEKLLPKTLEEALPSTEDQKDLENADIIMRISRLSIRL